MGATRGGDEGDAGRAGGAQPSTVKSLARRGVPLLPLVLPPLVYYLWLSAEQGKGALLAPGSVSELAALAQAIPPPTAAAVFALLGWIGFQALLQVLVPGPWVEGTPLADGTRLPYKLNGWRSLGVTVAVAVLAVTGGWVPAAWPADHLGSLLTTANIFAFLLSGYLLFHGVQRPDEGSVERRGPIYDYVMGTARNPRIGRFDLKLFFEARPGLIGWVLLDVALAARQAEVHGTVTTPMILVVLFQALYVADYFFFEEAILSTWDIRHENFGWMLCWGDVVWVPFTYTLQAQYLVHHPHTLPVWGLALVAVFTMAGYVIFRTSNLQKHRFRKDPNLPVGGRPPRVIHTAQGSLLLASGWWGLARHINYLGDLMMGLAWCLLCGFNHVLPYFYIIYFTVLLVHRERRDHSACRAKYGEDWQRYTRQVRWRIVPGIY